MRLALCTRNACAPLWLCYLALFIGLTAGFSHTACARDIAALVQSPHYVLLMRHATAPGFGDPPNYSLNDCTTQRNLSPDGRQQATAVGHWLRKQGLKSADVHTSPWCRCKETAHLLGFGGVAIEMSLASFFDDSRKAKEVNAKLQEFIVRSLKTKRDKALILVTHHVNILELTGENIGSADLVLARVNSEGQVTWYQVISANL